jgi:hypothetical protein
LCNASNKKSKPSHAMAPKIQGLMREGRRARDK